MEKSNLQASERALVCEKRREKMKKKLETKTNQQFGAEQTSGHGEMDLSPSLREKGVKESWELCSEKNKQFIIRWNFAYMSQILIAVTNCACVDVVIVLGFLPLGPCQRKKLSIVINPNLFANFLVFIFRCFNFYSEVHRHSHSSEALNN